MGRKRETFGQRQTERIADWLDGLTEFDRGTRDVVLSCAPGRDPYDHPCAAVYWARRGRTVEVQFDPAVSWFFIARSDRGTYGGEPQRRLKRHGLPALRAALAWLCEEDNDVAQADPC